jgi:hypothetical protein
MKFRALSVAALLAVLATPAVAQSVKIEFHNGRVNLSAQDAPIRTILAEWARLGGTKIINGDRVTGAPVTLELTDVPERQAIDVLLRGAAGYIVGARTAAGSGASAFDRILIVATSTPSATTASRTPLPPARGRVQAPRQQAPPPEPEPALDEDPEDDPPEDVAPDSDGRVVGGVVGPNTPAAIREAAEAARRRLAERRGQLVNDRMLEDDSDTPPPPASAPGANPFGAVPSFATPGVLAPPPVQTPPPTTRNRQPDPD